MLQCKNREKRKSTKSYLRSCESFKINPEGTRGPIGPEEVSSFLCRSWHQNDIKKFVNCVVLKNDIFKSQSEAVFQVFKLQTFIHSKYVEKLDIDIDIISLSHLQEASVVVTKNVKTVKKKKRQKHC